jgi:hypothetical protein
VSEHPRRAVPHIPPVDLRRPELRCAVCDEEFADRRRLHPLRLQMSKDDVSLPLLEIAFACKPCRKSRPDEVLAAHILAASKYIHRE